MRQWYEHYGRILPLARERARQPNATKLDQRVYHHVLDRRAAFHPAVPPKLRRKLLKRQTTPKAQLLEALAHCLLVKAK